MRKIEHIGIAVKDLTISESIYNKLLGTKPYKREAVPTEAVVTSFYRLGPNKIELVQSQNADGPIAKFIEKRGEGIHHIAFDVEDINSEIARLKKEGFEIIAGGPKIGADNKLVCFIHPKSAGGVLIELCQEIS